MTILDKVNEVKKAITITLDISVIEELKKLREKKKLRKISTLINELLKKWITKNKNIHQ